MSILYKGKILPNGKPAVCPQCGNSDGYKIEPSEEEYDTIVEWFCRACGTFIDVQKGELVE